MRRIDPEKAKSFTNYVFLCHQIAEDKGIDGDKYFKEEWQKLIDEAKPYSEVFPEDGEKMS
ncbi:MAG: hypothetical protein JSU78_01535 [Deltaproteobacteria bacterium]|nr:MAG: hypothetical protein JSU78_01535 [Deltaproteobacteria bacterium]